MKIVKYPDIMEGIIPYGCRWVTSHFDRSGRRIVLYNCGMSIHATNGKITDIGTVLKNSASLMQCIKRNQGARHFIFNGKVWKIYFGPKKEKARKP